MMGWWEKVKLEEEWRKWCHLDRLVVAQGRGPVV